MTVKEKEKNTQEEYRMVAKTMFGMEDILAAELLKLGAKDIEKGNRAVSFTGDKGFMYKANLSLRTALRILKPIDSFKVSDEKSLYNGIQRTAWSQYMSHKDTLAIDCSLGTDLFTHSQYVSQLAKDAVVDQFRNAYGSRPSVDLEDPSLRINLHISGDTCTVSLDSSGDSLHKRGYRDQTNLAPINEVLAAGLVMMTGWDRRSNFIDPMCGSGTILIEAALYANNIPPGYFRENFGFEHWSDFDHELWQLIFESTIGKITEHEQQIIGVELSPNVTKKAKENVKLAKVDDVVKIVNASLQDFDPPKGRGVVLMNPPYGERMNKDDINGLYKSIGDTLKKKYHGYDAWIISSNMEAFKNVGLRPSRKITVYNGSLECKFMKFQMYEGTKKIHKLNRENP
jgi:putative N6-adenine-specific DNA methylase